MKTNKDLCAPLSEWQIPYYCTKEIYNTFKCAWDVCSNILSACLPGTGAPEEQTVILSTKNTSNEITGMGSLRPQFECRCLVVNKIPQMLRCRVPFVADIWKQTRGNLKQNVKTAAIPPKCGYFKTWCYDVGVYNKMVA